MTFTYGGDPSNSDIEEVRFLVQDTNSAMPLLQDAEIQYLIDTWYPTFQSNVYVASRAAEAIAAKYAGEVSYSADGVSVSGDQLQTKYNQLATTLREQFKANQLATDVPAGGVMYGETLDPSVKPLSFSKDMHDNPRAGEQDFGGSDIAKEYYTGNDYIPIAGGPF